MAVSPDPAGSASLFAPLTLAHGPAWKNRFMLAPLTNCQSHADGTLVGRGVPLADHARHGRLRPGDDLRGACAAARPGLPRPARRLVRRASAGPDPPGRRDPAPRARSVPLQLHHAGIRSPQELIGETPVAPSDDAESGARALETGEVEQLAEDFIAAAVRAERAGFDGVEIHGAHGYIVCAFLSPETNHRDDALGRLRRSGGPALLRTIIDGVRARCRPDFQLGVRLSPERFGLITAEMRTLAGELMLSGDLDYLDMSLWDVFKPPLDPELADRPLIDWFADLPRGKTRLGVAGKIMSAADAAALLEPAPISRSSAAARSCTTTIPGSPPTRPSSRSPGRCPATTCAARV